MTARSKIEWTEQTWNPMTGCTKVSAGCKNCYAECMARRLHAMGTPGYENGFALTLHPERLDQPLKRKKPTVFFVNSMSDLFHEDAPDEFLDRVFSVIAATPHHTYQILTKRAKRMVDYFSDKRCPKNVLLGVSVENRRHGVPRIDFLRELDVPIRFLSVEPLLEDIGAIDLSGTHWVIVGGESGPRARPMEESWVKGVKDQADAAGVPFFFKQWGSRKKANGRLFLGQTWDDSPTIPGQITLSRST